MQTEIPDYETANQEAEKLFASLDITAAISAPIPDVKEEWPNILYRVTFSRNAKNLLTEYRLGVGHVDFKKYRQGSVNFSRLTADEESAIFTIQNNPGAQLKDKGLWAAAAAKLAIIQKVSPKPYEVFACVCEDGLSAHNESFENWASNFGYDEDSIKAKKIYDFCCDLYHQIAALIPASVIAQMAELHAKF